MNRHWLLHRVASYIENDHRASDCDVLHLDRTSRPGDTSQHTIGMGPELSPKADLLGETSRCKKKKATCHLQTTLADRGDTLLPPARGFAAVISSKEHQHDAEDMEKQEGRACDELRKWMIPPSSGECIPCAWIRLVGSHLPSKHVPLVQQAPPLRSTRSYPLLGPQVFRRLRRHGGPAFPIPKHHTTTWGVSGISGALGAMRVCTDDRPVPAPRTLVPCLRPNPCRTSRPCSRSSLQTSASTLHTHPLLHTTIQIPSSPPPPSGHFYGLASASFHPVPRPGLHRGKRSRSAPRLSAPALLCPPPPHRSQSRAAEGPFLEFCCAARKRGPCSLSRPSSTSACPTGKDPRLPRGR